MAIKRDLSLTPRKEDLRDAKPITIPIQFSLVEIKQHFEESLAAIKKQYTVADSLSEGGRSRRLQNDLAFSSSIG